ncbi:MAG: DNA repair protein RecN [Deltaproteobacteria bacterium]|nr:DNA repair protein RecN [Deltaproteobacteria bacterium]
MLVQLNITDFAIIESLSVNFLEGLNILSGETGAGKSILINAVNLILGGKASPDLIRTGAEKATVEALFHLPKEPAFLQYFTEMDIAFDGEVLIKRVVTKSGTSRVWINGSLATLQMVSKLGPDLISISGQNEHQLLLRPDNHLYILDDFGGLAEERLLVNWVYRECCDLREKITKLRAHLKEEEGKRELIEFQIHEIDEARLTKGEDIELEAERKKLANAEKLIDLAYKGYQTLYAKDESVLAALSSLMKDLEQLVSLDPGLQGHKKQLEDAQLQLEDLALGLRDFFSGLKVDPKRLEEIDDRFHLIKKLQRKYGQSIEDILSLREELSKEGDQIASGKIELEGFEKRLGQRQKDWLKMALGLSEKRHSTAELFEKKVEEELHKLGMAGTVFKIQFDPTDLERTSSEEDGLSTSISADGVDTLEFMISPNVGEDLRPLARIASGGELSRIMLALKTMMAQSGSVETLIFDEIDTGIGGSIATVVGEKLKALSSYHQILCITHLPQIAAFGKTHFLVKKMVTKSRTKTHISLLEKEDRVNEIARLLGGKKISEKTLSHAREMLYG